MQEYKNRRNIINNTSSNLNKTEEITPMINSYPASIQQKAQMPPRPSAYPDFMQLQQIIGNQAVIEILKNRRFINQNFNPKLPAEKSNDKVKGPIQKKENNPGLPDNLKSGVENLAGLSIDNVKVHYNSAKPAEIGAVAYTQGTDIHIAPGQEKNLRHELWHVIQQKLGKVKPTAQINGLGLNDSVELENEADLMAGKLLLTKSGAQDKYAGQSSNRVKTENQTELTSSYSGQSGVIQRAIGEGHDHVYVKSSENEVYFAKWNEKYKMYELYSLDEHGMPVVYYYMVSPDDKEYSITEKPEGVTFNFKKNGRRIETFIEPNEEESPRVSEFYKALSNKGSHDFSYKELRDIVEQVFENNPNIKQKDITVAIENGIKNFNSGKSKIELNQDSNIDIQLLVQHLLKYQSTNLGQLNDTPKNKSENNFREQEMEKSKMMIFNSSALGKEGFDLIIPKEPELKEGNNSLQDSMSGLIDVNRPLPRSLFEGETYKGVFLSTKNALKKSFDKAQKSIKKTGKTLSQEEKIEKQREYFNQSLFETLPEIPDSTVPENEGKDFIEEQLGFNYNSDEDSFDEKSDSDFDYEEDEKIYDPDDTLATAVKKRTTSLSSFALLSKIEAQKELIDLPDKLKTEKRKRMRKKIERNVRLFNKRHQKNFKVISKENNYLKDKSKMINNVLSELESEESSSKVKKEIHKAKEVKKNLKKFYFETKMGDLVKKNNNNKRWKSKISIFKNLGPKRFREHVFGKQSRKRKRKSEDDSD